MPVAAPVVASRKAGTEGDSQTSAPMADKHSAHEAAILVADYKKNQLAKAESIKPLLSEREKQLLRLVAEGRRNKEIAANLKLSPNSIETYRARLMKKLRCRSTAELVRYAVREQIAPL